MHQPVGLSLVRDILKYTEIYEDMQRYTGGYRDILDYNKVYWDIQRFTGVYVDILRCLRRHYTGGNVLESSQCISLLGRPHQLVTGEGYTEIY